MGSAIRWLGGKNFGKDGKTTVFKSRNRQNLDVKKMNVQGNLGPFYWQNIQHNAVYLKLHW